MRPAVRGLHVVGQEQVGGVGAGHQVRALPVPRAPRARGRPASPGRRPGEGPPQRPFAYAAVGRRLAYTGHALRGIRRFVFSNVWEVLIIFCVIFFLYMFINTMISNILFYSK